MYNNRLQSKQCDECQQQQQHKQQQHLRQQQQWPHSAIVQTNCCCTLLLFYECECQSLLVFFYAFFLPLPVFCASLDGPRESRSPGVLESWCPGVLEVLLPSHPNQFAFYYRCSHLVLARNGGGGAVRTLPNTIYDFEHCTNGNSFFGDEEAINPTYGQDQSQRLEPVNGT
uniref:HDC08340 n=1 Tax=Drosophila melanogaster TaxID=7227 RepID=Q6ILU0_DROME|nr:TPA_inf: HDC08340 [Drosophila melanogaster]